jgi:hypothetical protein
VPVSDDAFRHHVWSYLERSLAGVDTIEDYFRDAVGHTAELIEVPGSYSLSTLLYDNPLTVATTDRGAWDADQIEFDTSAGPCVEALYHGTLTEVVDLAQERRWPAWAAASGILGFQSAAGIPGEIGPEHPRIALNLYGTEPGVFSGEPMRKAVLFTQEVARTMPTALRIAASTQLAADLQAALASRPTIDQALGVLMAQNRCSRDAAFGILRRASQNSNTKVSTVAAAIIERFTGHPASPPPPFNRPGTAPAGEPRGASRPAS